MSLPDRLEFIERRFKLRLEVLVELLFLADRGRSNCFPRLQQILKLKLEFFDAIDWNSVDESVLHRPHHGHLLVHR